MKKSLILGLLVAVLLLFSGCSGGNSDSPSGASSTPGLTTVDANTTATPGALPSADTNVTSDIASLSISFAASQNIVTNSSLEQSAIVADSTSVSFSITAFATSGIATEGLVGVKYPNDPSGHQTTAFGTISPNADTPINNDGMASFTYNPPANIQELINLGYSGAVFTLYDTAHPTTANVDLNIQFTDPKYTHYTLTASPENNVSITAGSQSSVLEVYLEDSTTGLPVANEPITVENFDNSKGTLNNFSGTTDANGHIAFNYTSPSNAISTTPDFDITFKLTKATNVKDTVRIDFTTPSAVDSKYINYVLNAFPTTPVAITAGSQSSVIEVYLEDTISTLPVANESVIVEFFDATKGTLNSFIGTTDVSGHIAFNYISPINITSVADFNITFKLANDISKRDTVAIDFTVPSAIDSKYSTYALSAYPDNNVSIVSGAQSSVLEVHLKETTSGFSVANESVVVEFFDLKKGTLNSFIGTTDAGGHIAFNYTAPADITNAVDFNVVFKLANDTSKTDSVLIDFNPNGTLKDYTNYEISLVDANRTIVKGSQVELFDVYLKNNNPTTPTAAVGDTIAADFFDGNSGRMDSFTGVTDANGHVQFRYVAPSDLTSLDGKIITFRVQNTTAANNKVDATLSVGIDTYLLSKLQIQDSNITVSENAETRRVEILAFTSDGSAFDNGGFLTVKYPSDITNGIVSGGSFTSNTVNIVDGKAIFEFVGPDPLTSINSSDSFSSLNFTFVYSRNSDINTTLTVSYEPDIPKIVVNDINITKNGERREIDVTVLGKGNAAYPDGTITVIYPSSVLTGKDVGSFEESTIAVMNGTAKFIYTAASPLAGNDSLVFTFYHSAQPELSKKDFVVNIEPDPGQIVLTNYVLSAIYDTTINLETTKSMTFFVADEDGNKLNDSNITSITATVLNPVIGTLEDTGNNTGPELTITGKNSVQMNIKSNTLSGIIPIKVYAQFNNDQNLTKVFNVVVFSGPPTAMSLSYAGTSQDTNNSKFIENWVLTVTDKYNNLINTTPSISTGMITGYATSSAVTSNVAGYLFYPSASDDGTLADVTPYDTFTSKYNAFTNVDLVNDKLVLFGATGYKFDAFGKWDIEKKTNNELSLKDDYNGSSVTALGYAVGHNFRNETCGNAPVVANVYAKDGNNTLGANGSMIIQVAYDYYLVGKSTVLWVNLVGQSNGETVRIGTGKKVTLRGNGLDGGSVGVPGGTTKTIHFDVKISDTVEYYKNANFAYAVEVIGESATWSVIGSSMMDGNITNCALNGGVGYVDVQVTTAAEKPATVNLINVIPASEF